MRPGARLRAWRAAHRILLRDLADRLGISVVELSNLERGQAALNDSAVEGKLLAMGCSPITVQGLKDVARCSHRHTRKSGAFVDGCDPQTGRHIGGYVETINCADCGKTLEWL